jgi:hypothetical protein
VEDKFTQAELEKLLAPIALYPDALLAQVLPASAYPVQLVQAQRWLDKNKAAAANSDFSGADAQTWDPSVKALLRFPTVIRKLSDDLDWTTDLAAARLAVRGRVALQGNLDPAVLYAPPAVVRAEVARVLASYGPGHGHVFNLGHGIHPDVNPEHAGAMIAAVHELSPPYHA